MKPYGWLNTLYDVAQSGLFTQPKYNAIDSVRATNLYVVFTYLSWKTAHNEFEVEVKKAMENEARQKSNATRKSKR